MKVLSVIGTRPQYIKLKPIYETLLKNNVNHVIVDTCQHFSYNVSKSIIDDLCLKIDTFLDIGNTNEINFLSKCITKVSSLVQALKPDLIFVFGDTNTTFCVSIVAHKLGIRIAHIEAGERSESKAPEEVNRIYCDLISEIHFCSDTIHMKNVTNPILTGDLEYELLHEYDPYVSYEDFVLLTIHRQENMDTNRLTSIFEFLSRINDKIKFPIHHRTKKFILENNISLPDNVVVEDPYVYSEMVSQMSRCKFIITDSGGVHKCSPFFGKKSLVLRSEGKEWIKTYREGFSMRYSNHEENLSWLNNFTIARDKYFYLPANKMPSEIILECI